MTTHSNSSRTVSPLEKVLSLPELQALVAQYLEREVLALCARVSHQWHQVFAPFLWRKVLFRVPQDFSLYGRLVQILDLYMGNIPQAQRDHIRYCCPHLRNVHLHFQQMPVDSLWRLFEPEDGNGFVGAGIEVLEIYVAEFEVIPSILPWLTYVRKMGFLRGLKSLTVGNGQALDEEEGGGKRRKQIGVGDVVRYLETFPETRALCFGRIPIGETRRSEEEEEKRVEEVKLECRDENNGHDLDKRQRHEMMEEKEGEAGKSDNQMNANTNAMIGSRAVGAMPYPLQDLDIYPRTASVLSKLLHRAQNLRKLRIRKIKDPRILSIIARSCPKLQTFRYMGRGLLSLPDFDWPTFLQGYSQMETLHFEDVLVTDRAALTIADVCAQNLRYLTIHNGAKIGTQALLEMLRKCERLEWVQCTADLILGELFFKCNAWGCYGSLQVLRLFGVELQGLDENEAFRTRIRQLPRLRSLSIRGTGMRIESLLDEDELANTGSAVVMDPDPGYCYRYLLDIVMPRFKCRLITLPRLKVLLALMPRVEYINFQNGYDEEAREWLRTNRPNLDMGVVVW
ncbi:hypothetical protein BC939DRAFT_454441 [Gamsiella multidivaricata]|uniref:uncharacterized protein n=1 Tax=Gamsiella multidivaricata TaxID=101098 RepID=UPI00221F9931|nr:uncharacterized protein BC939DRAFT_454441 [Gamsiella multidivaricata]KAG0368783.1 hypothetical protein BGZ54_001152 [Gamsiella multidivaricata]KAI7821993.1 hypothetical protein BC939DRAFT_454441 [Gamsiella multidivaricata]